MTATPEPRSRLALVSFYTSFPVVASPRRSRAVTHRHVLGGPNHRVFAH